MEAKHGYQVTVHYIFLDIAHFTRSDRCIEDQAEIVSALNNAVNMGIIDCSIDENHRLFIPTGDGMCIALLNIDTDSKYSYDIFLQLALNILKSIKCYNDTIDEKNSNLKFNVRIGISFGQDNLIKDINGNANIAGVAISRAQRLMDLGDPGNIFVDNGIYEKLFRRRKYNKYFIKYDIKIKHGEIISAYQYIKPEENININTPERILKEQVNLKRIVAYYIYFATRYSLTIIKYAREKTKIENIEKTWVVTLWILAYDAIKNEQRSIFNPHSPSMKNKDMNQDIAKNCEKMININVAYDGMILNNYAEIIINEYLEKYSDCFNQDNVKFKYHFISRNGYVKFQSDQYELWKSLEMDKYLQY
jgi:hypothetical protein